MTAPTSLRLSSLTSSLSRSAERLSVGPNSNWGGMTGRWVKLHLPRTGSFGATRLSRWPTLEDSTYCSLSKEAPSRVKPPKAREMPSAAEGFSAMIRVSVMRFQLGPFCDHDSADHTRGDHGTQVAPSGEQPACPSFGAGFPSLRKAGAMRWRLLFSLG